MAIGNQNNVRYTLYSERQGVVDIPEPINYEDGNGNIYEQDKNSKGIFNKKSNSVELHGKGRDFLIKHNTLDGVKPVQIQKEIKDPARLDERWKKLSPAYLDTTNLVFEDEKGTVKSKYGKGGLQALIEKHKSDEYDLKNTTAITGDDIGVLHTENIVLPTKKIFLKSRLIPTEDEFWASTKNRSTLGIYEGNKGVPFRVKYSSDELISQPTDGAALGETGVFEGAVRNGEPTSAMYFINDRQKTQKIKMNFSFTIGDKIEDRQAGSKLNILFRKYENGEDFEYKDGSEETILSIDTPEDKIGQSFTAIFDKTITLEQGESWAFIVQIVATLGIGSGTGRLLIRLDNRQGDIFIEEDSEFDATSSKCLTWMQIFDRLLTMITGEVGRVKSNFMTSGEVSEDVLLNGFYIRNFPDIVNEGTEEERKIQFIASFKNAYDSLQAQHPLCWFIEIIGNKEYLRIEKEKYTTQKVNTIRFESSGVLIPAQKVKRTVLGGNYYTSLNLGSSKGGDGYEEVYGLQSFCGKANFNTDNGGDKEVLYSFLSNFRHGDVDVELCRRKQFQDFAETDTPYDSDIMVIKGKKQGLGYVPKTWQDVYTTKPTGIYDADSAYNFELSPLHLLLNHSYKINVGLVHLTDGNIRWISSNCNSSLITEIGEESGSIPHSILEKPKVYPMTFDFNLKISQEIEDQITGIGDFPNWYGLATFKVGNDEIKGYLIKCDANKEGKNKLIQAYL